MLKTANYEGCRLVINEYNPDIHEGKVFCNEGHLLIAKRGEVRAHHFSHRSGEGSNCSASEGKTSWHIWWQNRIIPKQLELRYIKSVGNPPKPVLKIADAVNIIGNEMRIIEFQNSPMAKTEMAFREEFYSRTDLLSDWGVPYCKSVLTWIFNLRNCDIDIQYIFGDLVAFTWIKGTKYMMNSKAETFYDLGKRDLIKVIEIHKPDITCPKVIGRLVSLEDLDEYLFKDILILTNDDDKRLNVHTIDNYKKIPIGIAQEVVLQPIIDQIKHIFFKGASKQKKKEIKAKITKLLDELY
jgi:hypothetical protein